VKSGEQRRTFIFEVYNVGIIIIIITVANNNIICTTIVAQVGYTSCLHIIL
jgi:hypothetical protein